MTASISLTGGYIRLTFLVSGNDVINTIMGFDSPPVVTATIGILELNEPISLTIQTSASVTIRAVQSNTPSEQNYNYGDSVSVDYTNRRLMPSITIALPTPAFIGGRPMLPRWWGKFGSTMTLTQGPGHIRAVPDPDPTVTSVNPPVRAGHDDGGGFARWSVRDLPDPNTFPGDFYWLGQPSSADGTTGIASACRQWDANGGSTMSSPPGWHSVYPFKPSVRKHVWYGPNGNQETITAAVRFNTEYIEHMWIDMGTGAASSPPITWIVVGLVQHYDFPSQTHPIMDSGLPPSSSGVSWTVNDVSRTRSLTADPTTYRLAMEASHTRLSVRTANNASKALLTPMHDDYKPKMFFAVINDTQSMAGSFSPQGEYVKKGSLDTTGVNLRHLVLGRKNGILDRRHSAHFVCFEMRMWNRDLDLDELKAQYHQLASTWKFNRYY